MPHSDAGRKGWSTIPPRDFLADYGRLIVRYEGEGTLVAVPYGSSSGTEKTFACSFHAAQTAGGDIVLLCRLSSSYGPIPGAVHGRAFSGTSVDGWRLESSGTIQQVETLDDEARHGAGGPWLTFLLQSLDASLVAAPADVRVVEYRFGLTNFLFERMYARVLGETVNHALQVRLVGDGVETARDVTATIAAVPEYAAVTARLRMLKGVSVTCEARVPVDEIGGEGQADGDRLCDVITTLTYVLSVARGTKVQYVYREAYTAGGTLVHRRHEARIVKPFTNQPILPVSGGWASTTRDFVQRGYTALVARDKQLGLRARTLDAYLDAKAEGDFAEVRGAKLAVALEALKHAYVSATGAPVAETVMRPKQFNKLLSKLVPAMQDELVVLGVDRAVAEGMARRDKLLVLNRPDFKDLIEALAREIGLALEPAALARFVESRNALVHQCRFDCAAQAEEDERPEPSSDEKIREYLDDVHFLDRVMLRALNYEGPYCSRSERGDTQIGEIGPPPATAPADGAGSDSAPKGSETSS